MVDIFPCLNLIRINSGVKSHVKHCPKSERNVRLCVFVVYVLLSVLLLLNGY